MTRKKPTLAHCFWAALKEKDVELAYAILLGVPVEMRIATLKKHIRKLERKCAKLENK